jgi:phosphatidylglycerophosphatase A
MKMIHHWFGRNKTQLHIAVDDATGAIVGAYFDKVSLL